MSTRPRLRGLLLGAFALLGLACQPSSPAPSAPAAPDAAPQPDAALKPDASAALDAGAPDAGAPFKRVSGAKRPPLASPKDLLQRPRTRLELPTTDAKTFLTNLDGQVEASRTLLDRQPTSANAHQMHASKLLQRAKVTGDLDETALVLRVTSDGLKLDPKHANLRLTRAAAAFTLHRWDEAKADVAELKKLHPDLPALEGLEAELFWNQGKFDEAVPVFERAAQARPSFDAWARLADVYYNQGDLKAADEAFAKAETYLTDTSPVPLAWLYVQRGLLRLHSGRYEEAKLFYEAAHERVPTYPMATEHLAEIEFRLGNHPRAVELYEQVIAQTQNPEFIAALAGVYEAMGQPQKAQELKAQARERFLALVKKHPGAMAGHGADFFLEPGEDCKLALKLTAQDVAWRPNPDTYAALAGAQGECGGDWTKADASMKKVLASPLKKAEFFWLAAKVAHHLKRPDEAASHKKAALDLNPRIADLEGELGF